jgi:FAD/FMN-containing dehydrogenase
LLSCKRIAADRNYACCYLGQAHKRWLYENPSGCRFARLFCRPLSVQQIVRIANHYRIPLYPISTGRNLGYGGPAPTYSGSVVVDLKRMNRILDVNEDNASCLVEPGVSYFDLYRHI